MDKTMPFFTPEEKKEFFTTYRLLFSHLSYCLQKEDAPKTHLSAGETANLSEAFRSQIPSIAKAEFMVDVQSLGEDFQPVLITQNEYMRRMKEMAQLQQGMAFYGEMPDMYSLVLNTDHRLVKQVNDELNTSLADRLAPIDAELRGLNARRQAIETAQQNTKSEDLTEAEKADRKQVNDDIAAQEKLREEALADYARTNKLVPQLIDLALLQNGLLRGEALNAFVKRSVELI